MYIAACEDGSSAARMYRPSQLPIYDSLVIPPSPPTPAEPTAIESYVCATRCKVTEGCDVVTSTCTAYGETIEHVYHTGVAHTQQSLEILRDPAQPVNQYGAIAAGGVLGLLPAARKGIIKKLLYAGVGAGALSAVIYPTEAVVVRDVAWAYTQLYGNIAYNFVTGTKPEEVKPAVAANSKGVVDTVVELSSDTLNKITSMFTPTTHVPSAAVVEAVVSEAKASEAGDPGMSNPADSDMYSARERK